MAHKQAPELIGTSIPDLELVIRKDGALVPLSTKDYFAGRKVVVFALPGAFTPTCSTSHLPRYDELAPVFAAHGVDEVACLSVNDAFVMEAWAKQQGSRHVTFLPDGNGDLSRALGMLVDKRELGFGDRSWRYSMLVDDGRVTQAFVEPDQPGDPFEVSDADTMLGHVAPGARLPQAVTVFTKPGCQFCARTKALLSERGMSYEEIELGAETGLSYSSLRNVTGAQTAPQVYIGGAHIGGLAQLEAHFAAL